MISIIEASPAEIRELQPAHDLPKANLELAKANRAKLYQHGCTAIDFMGAVGSGKTTLITRLIEKLNPQVGIAVVNGDPATSTDTDIIAKQGVHVVQIATGNACHLDANLVGKALNKINLDRTTLVFIENVGNLISPAEYPVGSKARVVVISITEGAYTIKKHPQIFLNADVVVINKIDLAGAMDVSIADLINDVEKLNPNAQVIPASCKFNAGVDEVAIALLAV
ncbi:MAG TPA: hydrogenase nickel incorporation protein HypB [Verrucomicrobiae bacterium]|nr:hydrogenase nickel incorporation protein HypB [Verrucomicrobiae bacterium]